MAGKGAREPIPARVRSAAGDTAGLRLAEAGLLVFTATIPFGAALPGPVRNAALLAVMAGLLLAADRARRAGSRLELPLLRPAVLFLLSTAPAIAFSTHPEASLERSAFLPVGAVLGLGASAAVRDLRALDRLSLVLAGVMLLLGLDALCQAATGASLLAGQPTFRGRIRAGVPHPNDLAMVPIFAPFALLLATSPPRWRRALGAAALALGFAAVLLSQSRNALLGFLALPLLWLALGGRRRPALLALAGLASALLLALALDVAGLRTRLAINPLAQGRVGLYLAALALFREAPLFGMGAFTFGEHYQRVLRRIRLPEGYVPEDAWIPWAHDLYLEALAERGLVGFAGLFAVLVPAFRSLVRAFRSGAAGPDAAPIIAAGTSLGCFLLLGVFDLTFLKDWVVFVFFLLAALAGRAAELSGAASGPRPAARAA